MIIKRKVTQDIEINSTIVCDLCGAEYSYDAGWDQMEAQEFVSIRHKGGFSSIFGDTFAGNPMGFVDVDICQKCFKEHIVDKMGLYKKDKE